MAKPNLQDNIELDLWIRAIAADKGNLSPEVARAVLNIQLSEKDHRRAHKLAQKNQAGTITPKEKAELEAVSRFGLILSILWSKARLSLKLAGKPQTPAA